MAQNGYCPYRHWQVAQTYVNSGETHTIEISSSCQFELLSRHGGTSAVVFTIKATYNVKFDRLMQDLSTAHAILHYVHMSADASSRLFSSRNVVIAHQTQAEVRDVLRLCARLEEGTTYGLGMSDYHRIWDDCCRFLIRHSLQRLSADQAKRLCRAIRDFFFP